MSCKLAKTGWLIWVAGALWASAGLAGAQTTARETAAPAILTLPLDDVPAPVRDRVRQVVQNPTLCSHAPVETFTCQPAMYHWLLDHQDRAGLAWRRMGARCVEISERGNGRFGWIDGQGSDVHWDPIIRGPGMRVWYAEGVVRTGFLSSVPVRAVVVLRHAEARDEQKRPVVSQQLSLYLYADSRAAALAKRLLGAALPRMADQYTQQMAIFFSALARHLDRNPDQIEPLLADAVRLTPRVTGGR